MKQIIHPFCALVAFELAACGALTGNIAAIALLTGFLILRGPGSPLHPVVVWLTVALFAAQILASLVVNLVTSTNDHTREVVFGQSGSPALVKGFGVYEMNYGSTWKFVASVVPEVIVILTVIALRGMLTAEATTRRVPPPKAVATLWGAVSAVSALISPTIIGSAFLLMALVIFSCIAFDHTAWAPAVLRTACLIGTIVGSIALATLSLAQNFALIPFFRDSIDESIGIRVFCNLTSWTDVRDLVQLLLIFFTTLSAQAMLTICVSTRHRHDDDEATDRTVIHAGKGDSQPLLGGRDAASHYTAAPTSRHLTAAAADGSRSRNVQPSEGASDCRSTQHNDGSGGGLIDMATHDLVDSISRAFRWVSNWIMNNFILLPLFPMLSLAASMVAFPSLTSISLFPTLFAGLMWPKRITSILLPSVIVYSAFVVTQYYIFATSHNNADLESDSIIVHIFLKETTTGWQLFEIAVSLGVFGVLLATYIQHAKHYNRHKEREREQRIREQKLRDEEQANRIEERRLSQRRLRSDSSRSRRASDAPASREEEHHATGMFNAEPTTDSTSWRFDHRGNERETEADVAHRAAILLEERRVRRIRSVFKFSSNTSRDVACFQRLTGREPTDSELRELLSIGAGDDPCIQVLRKRRILAGLPLWRQCIQHISVLLSAYSMNFTILFTFVAGSCVYHMDVIHAVVLVLFLAYFLLPTLARRYWVVLVAYIALLTLYEVTFTFIEQFVSVPLYLAPGIRMRTVGFVGMPSRWSAIPYFVVLFFVCGQWHVLQASTYSWDDLYMLYEWRQLLRVPAVRIIRQRITMIVAAAVFVALGLFEERSLLVQGFLVFFLVICICTAYGARDRTLCRLWKVASAYAGLVILAVSLYQFQDVANQVNRVVSSIPGCENAQAETSCQKEIGVVAPEGYVLTYFLAPWFVALVTAMSHVSSVGAAAEDDDADKGVTPAEGEMLFGPSSDADDEEHHNNNNSHGNPLAPTDSDASSCSQTLPTVLVSSPSIAEAPITTPGRVINNASLLAREPSAIAATGRSPSTAEMNVIDTRPRRSSSSAGDRRKKRSDLAVGSEIPSARPTAVDPLESDGDNLFDLLSAVFRNMGKKYFFGPDQFLFQCVFVLVHVMDGLGTIAAWVGREYGAIFVWVALYIAATTEYTLMAAAYAIFFVLDLSSITALVYCVLHLVVLYSYQFSFTPKISITSGSLDWAQLIGFIKDDSEALTAVGPVVVFFAVLFRAKTAPKPISTSAAECQNQQHQRKDSWSSYLHHHILFLVGYEAFVLITVLNMHACARVASGAVIAVIITFVLVQGRSKFFSPGWLRIVLQVLTTIIFLFELLLCLNRSHKVWEDASGSISKAWQDWAFTGSVAALFYSFAALVILHAVRNKEYNMKTIGAERPIEVWIHHHVYPEEPNMIQHMMAVVADPARVKRLFGVPVEEGGSFDATTVVARSPHGKIQTVKKQLGNILKHCPQSRLDEILPAVPTEDDGTRNTSTWKENVETAAVPLISTSASSNFPAHMKYHESAMTVWLTFVCSTSPVAFLSFIAGTLAPSIICIGLMIAGLLQFSFQENIHWKFYRLWPKVQWAYCATLLTLPLISNLPAVASWASSHDSLASILGIWDSDRPLGLDGARVTLLLMLAVQTRVYEEYWFEIILRAMRKTLRDRDTKHKELMAAIAEEHELDLAAASKRDDALRDKLSMVQQAYFSKAGPIPTVVCEAGVTPIPLESEGKDKKSTRVQRRGSVIAPGSESTEPLCGSAEGDEAGTTDAPPDAGNIEQVPNVEATTAPTDSTRTCKDTIVDTLLDWTESLIPHSYCCKQLRRELLEDDSIHPFKCFVIALLRAAERHTAEIVVLFVVANFCQSGTAFDALPFFVILAVASVYHPFAPLPIYDWSSNYIVLGILLKAAALTLSSHVDLTESLRNFLSWSLISCEAGAGAATGVDGANADNASIAVNAYGDLILDFVAFAAIVIHKHMSFANGVYSDTQEEKELRQADESLEAESAFLLAGSAHVITENSTPAVQSGSDTVTSPQPEAADHHANKDDDMSQASHEDEAHPFKQAVTQFVHNATVISGCGVDLYIYYTMIETLGLLVLIFSYYSISGSGNGSIVQNVQDNVLPGAFVLGLLGILLALVIDRMLYSANHMLGKLLFNVVYIATMTILFCVWRRVIAPPDVSGGMIFFILKSIYFYTSAWQLSRGFPKHRRHDPFTHLPDDILPWVGYQIYRGVPFLWEMRVVIDWIVSTTALRLPCYLKVENLYDTVYNRYVSIGEERAQQPVLGTAVKTSAKIADGVVRLIVILFAVLFPLLYYSTFNPVMGTNTVSQIQIEMSFGSSTPFFQSSLFNVLEYPGDLALWLQRTRPILGSYGINNKDKTVQLMDFSTCSANLWGISPQATRLLKSNLNDSYYGVHSTTINLQVSITRGSGESSVAQTISHPWLMSREAAGAVLRLLDNDTGHATGNESDSGIIILKNFYSPYVFNQPTQVQYFPAMAGRDSLDTEDCSISLRTEFDPLLQTNVHYWCLKCNSIFSTGNYPNSSLTYFPEWPCITTGAGCGNFNFELHATNFTPVPMYFVFFSDPIPQTLSFLPNIGIIAIYTTFVLAIGRVFRGMFTTTAMNLVQTDMSDPTPVAQLIEYIAIARECGDLRLEQTVYFELIDLMRSPEKLLKITGLHRRLHGAVSSTAVDDAAR